MLVVAIAAIVGVIVTPVGRFMLALLVYALTNTLIGGFILIMLLVATGVLR